MKNALFAATCLLLVTTADAGSRWQGPGWYQVVEKLIPGMESRKIILTPKAFATLADCRQSLQMDRIDSSRDEHQLETVYDFSCEQLTVRPAWDR